MKRAILALSLVGLTSAPALAASSGEWFFNPDSGAVVEGPVGSPQHYINLGAQPDAASAQRAAQQFQKVRGTIVALEGSRATLRAEDGRLLTVDVATLGEPGRLKVGDEATIVGKATSPTRWTARHLLDVTAGSTAAAGSALAGESRPHWYFNPDSGDVVQGPVGSPQRYIDLGPQPSTEAAQATARAYQRRQATVLSRQGSTVTVRADDGRVVTLEESQIAPRSLGELTAGDRLTLMGFPGRGAEPFVTRYAFRPEHGPTTAGPSAAPASGPDWYFNPANGDVIQGPVGSPQHYVNLGPQPGQAAAQAAARRAPQVRGQVVSVDGRGVTLRADDGRTLTVDTSALGAGSRASLSPGQTVTLFGRYVNDAQHFSASFVQEESGAALPRSR